MNSKPGHVKGAVAAGHSVTVQAGYDVLAAGGNAYDAAIAAFFAACIAEPVLASLGGGGFLLSQTASGQQQAFDFFVQTPCYKKPLTEIDFLPIWADFGTLRQQFHIGQGAVATPGAVKGIFAVHRQLGSLPMTELIQPAVAAARSGIRLDALQAYIFKIVSPILMASAEVAKQFSGATPGELISEGELFRFPDLANTLELLAIEGDELFYRGELAELIVDSCEQGGGHLQRQDLQNYQVICREPLSLDYRAHQLITNPPPSSGGILMAFALQLWQKVSDVQSCGVLSSENHYGSAEHLQLLAQVMAMTNEARIEAHIDANDAHPDVDVLLDKTLLSRYADRVIGRAKAHRGTTHISVIDQWHNVATLTVSNGEGCGAMVPGTGIMLNNMLGEEDLNPHGFQRWSKNQRMTSMMSPTIINYPDGSVVALGSGGSNRIRTAILQTVINLIDFKMTIHDAVNSPRLHFENDLLNVEKGFDGDVLRQLLGQYSDYKCWDTLNLFFGGVHSVQYQQGIFDGVGDPRRGGVRAILYARLPYGQGDREPVPW